MSPAVWSWVAAAASVSGLWISGYNPRWGWIYGICCQAVWVAYGWFTDQPGMIALSVAFVAIYGRNIWRWRGTRFQRREDIAEQASRELATAGRGNQ